MLTSNLPRLCIFLFTFIASAVRGFSYFDILARLKANGPDDAWKRLNEILAWFREVQSEGGYRAYYAKPGRGTMQGGGPPGGLGMDQEFYESVLVPQVMLYGFRGLTPGPAGFTIAPSLPTGWPSLTVSRVRLHDHEVEITAEASGRVSLKTLLSGAGNTPPHHRPRRHGLPEHRATPGRKTRHRFLRRKIPAARRLPRRRHRLADTHSASFTCKMRHCITALLLICTSIAHAAAAPPPGGIIFDTDMGGDCDDVGALFLLHGAVQRGEARLLGTMGCVSTSAIAPCLDAINTWFGRSEIPVGTLKDAGLLEGHGFPDELIRRYPHRHPAGSGYPDALALYRQILNDQPDGSVVIVAVGPLRNMANLLKADAALISKKVKLLHVMGGHYPPQSKQKDAEYNFQKDPASAALVCAKWPTPVLFNGEGGSTNSGRRVTYEMPEHNPLTMAYAAYPGVGFAGDRLSWDPVSCLVAVRGAAPWYEVVNSGRNVVDPATGMNAWQVDGAQGHSYLVLKKGAKAAVETALEEMMTAGKGRPADHIFNTAYYAQAGMCQITASGAAEATMAAIKAFDRDEKTAWLEKAESSWIQCQYADGRKSRVTSYAVVCREKERLPRTLELSGSNDRGSTWTRLDLQEAPSFSEQAMRRDFPITNPAKWNLYRLRVTAADAQEGVQISTLEFNEAIRCQPGVVVASIALDQPALRLPAHSRATLNATVAPLDTFDREVAWSSSDPAVAEVRRIGEQTAIVAAKHPGTCTITATIGNVRQTCVVTVTASTLPAGWSYDELGAPPISGSVSVADGRFTLTGCGHAMTGFWERVRDQGAFLSQSVTGDSSLSARLTSLAPNVGGPSYQWDSRPSTAAGVMLRESLTEGCGRYALIEVQATGKLVFRWRDKAGPDDSHAKELGKVTLPLHLKLTRKGDEIQVFTSSDGQQWGEPLMSHASSFAGDNRLGLFVCSGNTFASSTAVFESILPSHE